MNSETASSPRRSSLLRAAAAPVLCMLLAFTDCSAGTGSTPEEGKDTTRQKPITQPQKSTRTMTETQTRGLQALTMDNEAYFDVNAKNVIEVQQRFNQAISGSGPMHSRPGTKRTADEMLLIKTPETITEGHKTIPMLIASAQSGHRMWDVDYDVNTASVLTNLENGEVYVQWPFIIDKRAMTRPGSREGEQPDALNAGAMLRGVRYVDLREVYLDYKWIPSHYSITLIEHDWVSNTELFELKASGAKPSSPDLAARYQELFSTLSTGATSAGGSGPFALRLPDQVAVNAAIPVHLELNMAVEEIGLKRPIVKDGQELLPVAILLFEKDDDHPALFNFTVPVQKKAGADGREMYQAAASLDLRKALKERELEGTFMVYVNVGKHLFGPQRIVIGGR